MGLEADSFDRHSLSSMHSHHSLADIANARRAMLHHSLGGSSDIDTSVNSRISNVGGGGGAAPL